MTIEERIETGFEKLKGFFTSSSDQAAADLTTAKQTISTLQTENEQLKGKTLELEASVTAKDTEIAALKADVTAKEAKVAELQATIDKPEGEIEKRASAKAQQITRNLGVAPVAEQLSNTGNGASKTRDELWAEYQALPVEQRNAFYAKNRAHMREA
jgi:septal ring factor EnvC (AmiA/AmiB activator)